MLNVKVMMIHLIAGLKKRFSVIPLYENESIFS